jgi:hypothetical protein
MSKADGSSRRLVDGLQVLGEGGCLFVGQVERHPGEMVRVAASGKLRAGRLSPYRPAAICRITRVGVSPHVSQARLSDRAHDRTDHITD